MRKLSLLALACFLTACGPDFSGTYAGPVAQFGPCSDGSSINATENTTWTLSENNGDVSATFSGACSGFSGSTQGNVVTVRSKSCVPMTSGGATLNLTITDGRLTLNADTLAILLHATATASGTASGTCNVTWSGNMTRR